MRRKESEAEILKLVIWRGARMGQASDWVGPMELGLSHTIDRLDTV